MQATAIVKDEYAEDNPEGRFPKWTAHVGEDVEHLKDRMRQKGCDPSKYDWSGE